MTMEVEEEDEDEEVMGPLAAGLMMFCPPFWQHGAAWWRRTPPPPPLGFLRLTLDDCILALKDDWLAPLWSPLPKSTRGTERGELRRSEVKQ